ncbi:MAG: hypothetical protein KDD15_19400 [Lewinella sp.]|nr:hypothetical protein [Lewinella sp.]
MSRRQLYGYALLANILMYFVFYMLLAFGITVGFVEKIGSYLFAIAYMEGGTPAVLTFLFLFLFSYLIWFIIFWSTGKTNEEIRDNRLIPFIAIDIFLMKLINTILISLHFNQESVESSNDPEWFLIIYQLIFWLALILSFVTPFLFVLLGKPKTLLLLLIVCLSILCMYGLDALSVFSLLKW